MKNQCGYEGVKVCAICDLCPDHCVGHQSLREAPGVKSARCMARVKWVQGVAVMNGRIDVHARAQ